MSLNGSHTSSSFAEQAAKRVNLYADALTKAGMSADKPMCFIAALTTGLPGEVIELALIDEHGRPLVRRARPHSPISPGAARHHGLSDADLAGELTLAEQYAAFAEVMIRSDASPLLVTWPGQFICQALTNSLPEEAVRPALVDVQDLLTRADDAINPDSRYPLNLARLRFTVEMPQPEPGSALKNALALRTAVYHILQRKSVTVPPLPAARQAKRPPGQAAFSGL